MTKKIKVDVAQGTFKIKDKEVWIDGAAHKTGSQDQGDS
jgi:hypothetical protein